MPPWGIYAPGLAAAWLVTRANCQGRPWCRNKANICSTSLRAPGSGRASYRQMHYWKTCPKSFSLREAAPVWPTSTFLLNSYSSEVLFYWFGNLIISLLIFLTCCLRIFLLTKMAVNLRKDKVCFIILFCCTLMDIIVCLANTYWPWIANKS